MIYLEIEDFKKLVLGRFRSFKCTHCDGNGWYWVHEDGHKRNPGPGESEDDFYRHTCDDGSEECGGTGFRVVFDEDD